MVGSQFQVKLITIICFSLIFIGRISALPINFAVPASGEGLKRLLLWTPIIGQIENETGLEINLIITRNHGTIKEELKQKNYDFAVLDHFWYDYWGNDNICQPFLESNVTGENRSLLIVHKNSIFRTLSDLKNGNIALTVPYDSAAGFYIPLALMYKHGIDPFTYFNSMVFPETFESILKSVSYGKLDSGFITSEVLDASGNLSYRNNIRIILESGILPGPVIVIRNDFNPEILKKIKHAFIHITDNGRGKELLQGTGISDFEAAMEEIPPLLNDYLNILGKNNAAPE